MLASYGQVFRFGIDGEVEIHYWDLQTVTLSHRVDAVALTY